MGDDITRPATEPAEDTAVEADAGTKFYEEIGPDAGTDGTEATAEAADDPAETG